ncbi:MAG: hydroxyacid dehydrogenase [Paracoccus sp. (in: a-proteobacteria)]|nr:hydroxyacid dehydrogenase [Paracoccus sp. (in: a-proteobacteria)]
MPRIVISEFMDEGAVARLSGAAATLYDPTLVERPDALSAALAGAEILIVRNRTQVTAGLLDAGPALRGVGRLGVGLDNIDLPACRERGIAVWPATGANDLAVAEYVITTAMMLLRGAYLSSDGVSAGNWPRQQLIGGETSGRVMGLLGLGAIAREVALRARALGMEVIAHDPHLGPDDPAWSLAGRSDLAGLLAGADVISLHVPLTPETRHIIDEGALARMRRGAVVINAARGGVVDEAALIAALERGHLGGAALDVFETEPLGPQEGAGFAHLRNVILTPHIAGVTAESNIRVSNVIADIVLAHLGLEEG